MPKIKFDQIYETLKENIVNNRYPDNMLPRENWLRSFAAAATRYTVQFHV